VFPMTSKWLAKEPEATAGQRAAALELILHLVNTVPVGLAVQGASPLSACAPEWFRAAVEQGRSGMNPGETAVVRNAVKLVAAIVERVAVDPAMVQTATLEIAQLLQLALHGAEGRAVAIAAVMALQTIDARVGNVSSNAKLRAGLGH
jgi:hypothetical protein